MPRGLRLHECVPRRRGRPIPRVRGTRKGLKELETLVTLSAHLIKHINSLSADALRGFGVNSGVFSIAIELDDLIFQTERAIRRVRGGEPIPPPNRRGKPYAALVTDEAAKVYSRLTGKRPTLVWPTGKFPAGVQVPPQTLAYNPISQGLGRYNVTIPASLTARTYQPAQVWSMFANFRPPRKSFSGCTTVSDDAAPGPARRTTAV